MTETRAEDSFGVDAKFSFEFFEDLIEKLDVSASDLHLPTRRNDLSGRIDIEDSRPGSFFEAQITTGLFSCGVEAGESKDHGM